MFYAIIVFSIELVREVIATLELMACARGHRGYAVALAGLRESLAVLAIWFIVEQGIILLPVFVAANMLGTFLGMGLWKRLPKVVAGERIERS